MADTAFRDPSVELVPRASAPATAYAEYKALRNKINLDILGGLEPAIRASTVVTLDRVGQWDPLAAEWPAQFNPGFTTDGR
jgi:hypothetical protein